MHSSPLHRAEPLPRRGSDHHAIAWGVVAIGVAIAAITIVGASLVAALLVPESAPGEAASDLPYAVATIASFFGFFAAGNYVARHAWHDRMLHAVFLVLAGLVLVGLLDAVDMAAGWTIERLVSGDRETGVHAGLWLVSFVIVPAATMLGAAIVDTRGADDEEL